MSIISLCLQLVILSCTSLCLIKCPAYRILVLFYKHYIAISKIYCDATVRISTFYHGLTIMAWCNGQNRLRALPWQFFFINKYGTRLTKYKKTSAPWSKLWKTKQNTRSHINLCGRRWLSVAKRILIQAGKCAPINFLLANLCWTGSLPIVATDGNH